MVGTTYIIWGASWQNQQSECAPSEDSDQPGHLPSLIRVFAVRMKKAWTAKTLIRLGGCPGWSVFAGCTLTLLVLSRGGSFLFQADMGSQASLDVDRIQRKNDERLRRLQNLNNPGMHWNRCGGFWIFFSSPQKCVWWVLIRIASTRRF